MKTLLILYILFNSNNVKVTGYSPEPSQTDDTPFLAKCGPVEKQTIALSRDLFELGLKCSQKVLIFFPEKVDNKYVGVYVVNDTMHKRKRDQIDVFKFSKLKALDIGIGKKAFLIWVKL